MDDRQNRQERIERCAECLRNFHDQVWQGRFQSTLKTKEYYISLLKRSFILNPEVPLERKREIYNIIQQLHNQLMSDDMTASKIMTRELASNGRRVRDAQDAYLGNVSRLLSDARGTLERMGMGAYTEEILEDTEPSAWGFRSFGQQTSSGQDMPYQYPDINTVAERIAGRLQCILDFYSSVEPALLSGGKRKKRRNTKRHKRKNTRRHQRRNTRRKNKRTSYKK